MPDSDKAYIGVKPCGCVTAVMVAGYGTKREEMADLKEWMRTGRRVEITTVGEARPRFTNCPHGEAPVGRDAIDAEAERLVTEGRSK